MAERGTLVVEQTAWYRKSQATFHDVLTALRRQIWQQWGMPTSPTGPDVGLLPRSTRDRLLYAACF